MRKSFEIISLNISREKGTVKEPAGRVMLVAGRGIEGDAHAGPGKRQVSLLAEEDIDTMRASHRELPAGTFAENITTKGVDLSSLPVGTRLTIGGAVLEISQIGKECHAGCAIREMTGDCVMPTKGVFAVVIEGGEITDEDTGHYDI
jgi:MOSC domain-containing protein YiiM